MDINTFAQTLFYFVSSIAILVVGGLLGIVVFHVIKIVKNLEIFSDNLNETSAEIKGKVNAYLDKLADTPIISLLIEKLFKRENSKGKKGRTHKQE